MVVLLLCAAGVAYAWFHQQVSGANDRVSPEIRVALTEKPASTLQTVTSETQAPPSPSAMNLLLLGSDHREEDEDDPGRSDTIILVHVDPDQDYLSLLSLPRDLRVKIPGHGMNKINYAYAAGGGELTIRTIQELTGVDIDHYLEVDFNAFCDITDSLGGVYVDVDKRYYNDNPRYELINLAPGYRLLHGSDALDYVRFRRDLNLDFGRMERQQIFLSAIKDQAMGWDLPFRLPGLVSSLFSNVATDLGANDILELAYWGIGLNRENIRRIALVGVADELDEVSYVFVDDEDLARAVSDFLTAPGPGSDGVTGPDSEVSSAATVAETAPDLSGVEVDVLNANGRAGEAAAAGEWLGALGATIVTVDNAGRSVGQTLVECPSGMASEGKKVAEAIGAESVGTDSSVERVTVVLGDDFALPTEYSLPPGPDTVPSAGGWKTIAQMVPFAVRAPFYLPEGYSFSERVPTSGATYNIEVGGGSRPAFKMVYRLKENGHWTDQYMGIMETTWVDAPAACEGREVTRDGITYTIVGSRDKVERIWWKADGVLYWVSNTIFNLLSEDELLAVAESMIYIPPE